METLIKLVAHCLITIATQFFKKVHEMNLLQIEINLIVLIA